MKRVFALFFMIAACSSSNNDAPPIDAGAGGTTPDAMTGGPPGDAAASDRWLHASSLGVAFSHFPSRSVLTRALTIQSVHGPALAWTADVDQPWLTVTARGMTGSTLVLTADPSGLAVDKQYTATVRVRSSDPTVRNEQDIRVGLWIGSTDPQPVTSGPTVADLVADPVLPRLYTNAGTTDGSPTNTDITIYDVYTGKLVGTFAAVVGFAAEMAISSDGTILFVNDVANRRVVALDTTTGQQLQVYPWASERSNGLAYARPNGHPVLILGNSKVFDVDTALFHSASARIEAGFDEDVSFAVDAEDHYAYGQNRDVEPSDLVQYELDYDPRRSEPLVANRLHEVNLGLFGHALCVAADGSQVYAANGGLMTTPVLSAAGFQELTPIATRGDTAVCGWNGLFFGGDGAVYHTDGSPLDPIELVGSGQQVVLSGDNTRIIGAVTGFQTPPMLNFRAAPSP